VKNIFHKLLETPEEEGPLVLATLIGTEGSVPQVSGASAIFYDGGLLAGTLGGGILEGDAANRAASALEEGVSKVYNFNLDTDINAKEGAICGGRVIVLLDADPDGSRVAFEALEASISKGNPGVLVTLITGLENASVERSWIEGSSIRGGELPEELAGLRGDMIRLLKKRGSILIGEHDRKSVFLEAVYPLPMLYIAGAGHIGRALARQAVLLDYEVTVIDDRQEYANRQNIPDADHIIVAPIGEAVIGIPKTQDTYIVIVTRGHRDDAAALRACIDSEIPYIGMIGSRKKVGLMREEFMAKGWATAEQFDRVHAPVGLDIGSRTVEEISVSIAAQLIKVRYMKYAGKSDHVTGIILAAGESSRMGKPKLFLPFGDKSMIEKVVINASWSLLDKIIVVTGAEEERMKKLLQDYHVEIVRNKRHRDGMLSSVQCGLQAISENTDAVMILLGDQPMISHAVIDGLIALSGRAGKGIILATYDGQRGHPLLFGRKYVDEIIGFSPDMILKDLLGNHPADIEEMETGQVEILMDIDNNQDYKEALKHHIKND